MSHRFFSDSHVHSDNSSNALDPVIKMCETAFDRNLYSITIVDNCECDTYGEREYKKSLRQSFFESRKAQNVFKNNLNVFSGIEIGQPHVNPFAAIDALSSSDFDFVLGAIHKLKNLDNFLYMDYSDSNVYSILDNYFNETLEMIEWGNFDSLAHFNYPLKYITGRFGIEVDSDKILGKMRMVLTALAKKDKALELNMSGSVVPDSSAMSNTGLLREFKKAGGKYVTVGSGAHQSDGLVTCAKDVAAYLKNAGFEKFTVFKNRVPILLSI